jgi:hypothetical protein
MHDMISRVEASASDIMAVDQGASVETLCQLLVSCEKAQHQYQWASGFLLLTLMDKPDAPKKPSAFADWLGSNTGLTLTQNEIKRRVTVYKFYAPFADSEIIALIENGGIRMAYDARHAIDRAKPEQVRAVLQARIDNPDTNPPPIMPKRRPPKPGVPVTSQSQRSVFEAKVMAAVKTFDDQDWVPLALVVDLLTDWPS